MRNEKPYYAVIFTNRLVSANEDYSRMAVKMEELARLQPGYLGFETARDGLGISVSYWDSLEAIANWKSNSEHLFAQQKGISDWYDWYKVRICRVEREYEFSRGKI